MTKFLKRPISILLAVLMIAGIFTALPLTAYAAPTETLLTTITATGKEQANYSTANVATVSFSYTAGGSSAYLANWGWWGYGWTATVNAADGYTITKCVFYDDKDRTATDSEAPFVVETTEEDKTPQVNGTPILANTSKGIKKIEVYGYATPTTYTVTWKNGDTVLETDTDVESGAAPSYGGETPTKAEDADNTYEFSGWYDGTTTYGLSDTLPNVTTDVTYTATFEATPKTPSAYAGYVPAEADDATALAAKVVKFNGMDWYLIEDNSTSETEGTVTLFAKECVGASVFNPEDAGNSYSGSTVETYVNNWYTDNISTDAKTVINGNGAFLLTADQANNLSANVRKCLAAEGVQSNYWFLCTPGGSRSRVACVSGDGEINGYGVPGYWVYGVRPALKLNLESVIFDSESKSFTLKPAHTHSFTYSVSGATITATCSVANCTLTDSKVTLKIADPANIYYDDKDSSHHFTLIGLDDFNRVTGKTISVDNIVYYKGDNISQDIKNNKVKLATYKAKLTVEGVTAEHSFKFTAKPVAHTHSFTYSANGSVITATCNGTGTCDLANKQATLTILAPSCTKYNDGNSVEASIAGTIPGVTTPTIRYQKGSITLSSAPSDAGTYSASITLGSATAKVNYTIEKADTSYTSLPTANTLTYNGNPQDLVSAGTTAGGQIAYTAILDPDREPDVYQGDMPYSFSVPQMEDAGTYYVWYKLEGGKNYNSIAADKLVVTIAQADIHPNVSLEGWTLGEPAKKPVVSGNSGNGTVTFKYKVKGADDSTYTEKVPTDANDYTVKAIIAETANYNGGEATADFTIAKADITPTVTLEGWTYGDEANTPSVSGNTGNGDVTFLYKVKDASDMSCTEEVPTDANEYTVKAMIAETANYNGGEATADFTIAKADITPTVTLEGWAYGDEANTPSVSGNTGNGDVTYSYAVKGSEEFSDTVPTNKGYYTVKATIAATTNYNGGEATADFAIAAADINPTVTLAGWTYGEEANTPVVDGNTGNGDVTYTYAVKGSDEFSADVPTNAGEYTVKAEIAAAGNYANAVATADFTIEKADINPTVTLEGWTYGEDANDPSVSGNTGNGTVTYTYAVKGSDEFSDTVPTNAGDYTVKASVAATSNYKAATATADFTIEKADITPTVTLEGWAYGADAKTPVVTGNTGNGDVTYTYASKGSDEFSDTVPTDKGYYTVKATIAATTNYNGGEATADFAIAAADINPTVTLAGWTYGEEANTPVVDGNTGNGDVTYTYAVKGSDEFSADVPTNAGEYTVKAEIAAAGNYANAVATADFTIAKADIELTVAIEGWTYGEEANKPVVDGNTGSGEVTFAYKAKDASDMSNTDKAPTDAGEYTVKALIAATDNYNAAEATADFTIAKAALTVTAKKQTVNFGDAISQKAYTVKGLVDGDKIKVTLNADVANNTIKPVVDAGGNYTVTKVDGILYVKDMPIANALPKGKKIVVNYGKVKNADGYKIYAGYCGSNNFKVVKTVKGNTTTSAALTKINGKAVNTKGKLVIYVVAYKNVNGKQVYIVRGSTLHIACSKNKMTNAKSVKVAKKAVTLKKGKTSKISATVTLVNKNAKEIKHVPALRYASSDKKIAKVSSKGKITAVSKGTATIYVYTNNGKKAKVKVTVK